MKQSLLSFLSVSCLLLAACSSSGPSYIPCPNGDSDCPVGSTCMDGECRPAVTCSGDGDCQSPRVCLDGYCRLPLCNTDEDCPGTEHCQDHVCVAGQCRSDDDCPGGQHCDQYACVDDECLTDDDCASDEYCDNGSCQPRQVVDCSTDQDCRSDELCLENICQVPPACSQDDDCPTGTICQEGTCARGCYQDADCPSGGIPQVCRDGHCRQQCIGDNTCPGGLICENNACVEPQCASDDDCSGQYVRCRAGRCETYTPCSSDADCNDANFICLQNICEELPACAIDSDCANQDVCQDTGCLCEDSHCHPAQPCTSDEDCDSDRDCVGGICVPFVCRGPEDCPPGQVCSGGQCIAAGNPDSVYQVIVLTPGGPIRQGQVIQLEALALALNGEAVPGITFHWSSSEPNRASVDAAGLLTGGSEAGDTLVTAIADNTNPPVTSDPVVFTSLAGQTADTVTVTVVDRDSRSPLAGATVMMVSGNGSETQTSDDEGQAVFSDPGGPVDIHVFETQHDYLSVLGTLSRDLLLPLGLRSNPNKAGGFTGQMTFSGTGEVSLGLAGASIGGELIDLNFSRLMGEIFTVTVSVPGMGNFDVTLPGQMVLSVEYGSYPFPIKSTYYVEGQRGLRTAWAMGGKLAMSTLQDIMGAGGSAGDILGRLLPYFAVFDHDLRAGIDIFPIPKVVDSDDIDGDGDTSEMRPDWSGLQAVNLAPTQPQTMTVYLQVPDLPSNQGSQIRSTAILAGSYQVQGLTPLGITSETADDAGHLEPFTMKLAPAYGGLETGRYLVVVLAIPGGTATTLPSDVAMVLYNGTSLPPDLAFEQGFLDFAEDASYSTINRTLTASAVAGASLYRATFLADDGQWEVLLPATADQPVQFTLPPPPDGMGDPGEPLLTTLDPIALLPGLDYDELVSLSADRTDIDMLNLLMTACSRHEL